jgi:hypothetical protein
MDNQPVKFRDVVTTYVTDKLNSERVKWIMGMLFKFENLTRFERTLLVLSVLHSF